MPAGAADVKGARALDIIRSALAESSRVKLALGEQSAHILHIATRIAEAFQNGKRLYACGNGGSACDAMHLVEELVARYKLDRPGLPAHHLMDASTLTCWSNDYEFRTIFRRQVETHGQPGDVLVAISTSGNSENVLEAVDAASAAGLLTIGLTGKDGGRMRGICDELIVLPSDATERIQEGHITIIHLWCELIERMLFGDLRTGPQ
jgi:D-sedoheptulose 7-phosphate isomerase